MSNNNKKIISINESYGGVYDSEHVYRIGNIVSYNGNTYIADIDVKGIEPTNNDYWTLYTSNNNDVVVDGNYDDIKQLVTDNKLEPGKQYIINDYQYIYKLDNVIIGSDDSGYPSDKFSLVLTATSNHSFDKRVSAVPQPNSSKYYLTQLDKFIIEYDIHHKISNDKGVITFMKDYANNEMPFDIYNQRQYIGDDIKTTYSVGTNYPYLFGGTAQWNSTTDDSTTKFYNNKIENVNCFYGNYLSYNSKFYNNNFGKTITFGYNILSGYGSTIQSCTLSGYGSNIQYCILSGIDSTIQSCILSGIYSTIQYCTLSGYLPTIQYCTLSGYLPTIQYCTLSGY